MKISLSDLEFLSFKDLESGKISYGCDQEWFSAWWQRLAGCGTSVAANIILYLDNRRRAAEKLPVIGDIKQASALMEELWKYVTPTVKGINTTKLFYEPLKAYTESKGLEYTCSYLDLPADRKKRPSLKEAADFLREALSLDVPAAFLNLNSGAVKNLEPWHWVTVVSLESGEDENCFYTEILDEGKIIKIDFPLWYQTTRMDGGLVYFAEKLCGPERTPVGG